MFDDSFEHEAWNDSDSSRIILIFDVWHSDFTDKEVKFFRTLNGSRLRMERQFLNEKRRERAAGAADDVEDFYDIIERAGHIVPSEEALWAGIGDLSSS